MKIFYIIFIGLSSFFNMNYANAIFIPSGALQSNETPLIDLETMRPRNMMTQQIAPYVEQTTSPTPELTTKQTTKQNTSKKVITKDEQITQSTRQATTNKEAEKTQKTKKTTPAPSSQEVAQKLSKYSLDTNTKKASPKKEETLEDTESSLKIDISQIEALEQKSITDLLNKLPYINKKDPSFKQAYANYAMNMKILYKHGTYNTNSKQDKTLEKANTIRRFTVE